MPRKLTQEEFERKIREKDPSFKVIGKYEGYYDENGKCKKILLEHECGHQDEYAISTFMQGRYRCKKCNNRVYTQEKYEEKVHESNPNIKIIGKFSRVDKKVKCHCMKCGHEWETQANLLYNHGCPVCSGVYKSHEMFCDEIETKFPNQYKILSKYNGVYKRVKIQNLECGHEFECSPRDLLNGDCKCPYCNGKRVLVGFNDLWTVNPDIAKFLENPDDGYKYTNSSGKRVWWKCSCGNRLYKTIYEVTFVNSLRCPICSDGFPMGEKIVYSLLLHGNVKFTFRTKFEWSNKKEYDFYLPDLNTIIEVNGIQHYREIKAFTRESLEDIQSNDKLKHDLALQNGILNYIYIDARTSDPFDIIENIKKSALYEMLNLDSLTEDDWISIIKRTSKSFVFEVSDLWNDGLCISEIQEKTKIDRHTIRCYLIRAAKINLCDYTSEKSRKRIWRNYAKQ